MRFKGLCLLEHKQNANAMVVHLIDAKGVGLGEHFMKMRVPKSAIETELSDAAVSKAVVKPIGDTEFYEWRLEKRKVVGPPTQTPNLIVPEDVPKNNERAICDDDEGWKSLHWVPDLQTLSGATKVDKPADTTITVNNGEFRSMRADGSGPHTIWKFMSNDKEVLRRRLTNQVLYLCPSSTALTITLDSDPIVFKAGATETIEIDNLPDPAQPLPDRELNMEHFKKFYDVVNAKLKPEPVLHEACICKGFAVEPDYCPPGRIRT
jgi:hypothetical protein